MLKVNFKEAARHTTLSCKNRIPATCEAQAPVMSDHVVSQVLDAPGLGDDFYLNLLDWSQQGLLAVALRLHIYVYNTITCKASVYVFNVITCKASGHVCKGLWYNSCNKEVYCVVICSHSS